jgi:hypothetical protein
MPVEKAGNQPECSPEIPKGSFVNSPEGEHIKSGSVSTRILIYWMNTALNLVCVSETENPAHGVFVFLRALLFTRTKYLMLVLVAIIIAVPKKQKSKVLVRLRLRR